MLQSHIRIVYGVAVVAVAIVACRNGPRVVVRTVVDSAGIQLITIPAPNSSVPKWVILTDNPIFVAGGHTDSIGQFNSIGNAVVLPGGRVAVATDDEFRIHVFNSLGHPIARFGRKGDGPGELARRPVLYVHGDSLIAVQNRRGRVKVGVWSTHGEIIREYEGIIRAPFDNMYGSIGIEPNGNVLVMTALIEVPVGGRGGPHRAKVTISRVSPSGGDASAVLGLPGDDRYGLSGQGGWRDMYVKFGKTTMATVAGGAIQSGTNDGFVIDSWTFDGHLQRRLRIAIEPHRVTKAMRERHRQEVLNDTQPETRRFARTIASLVQYADYLPSYDALYATQDGGSLDCYVSRP